jgi:hypothetical protein
MVALCVRTRHIPPYTPIYRHMTVYEGICRDIRVSGFQKKFGSIWNLHHLDKTRRFRTSRYKPVYTGMSVFILTYTGIYQHTNDIPNRHGIYLYILYQRNDGFSIVGVLHSCRIMQAYTFHVQYNTSWCFKCKMIHVLTSCIETRYIHVHTGIYFHTNVHQGIYW